MNDSKIKLDTQSDLEIICMILEKANISYVVNLGTKTVIVQTSVWFFNADGSLNHVGRIIQ